MAGPRPSGRPTGQEDAARLHQPVHSLSNLLEKDVFGKAAVVCDEEKCYAFEIDTRDTIERSKRRYGRDQLVPEICGYHDQGRRFIESATMNPAFEESAMFENMMDLMFKDEYEFYVFDTAPRPTRDAFGNVEGILHVVEKMLNEQEEAKSLREMLSFSKKEEKDLFSITSWLKGQDGKCQGSAHR